MLVFKAPFHHQWEPHSYIHGRPSVNAENDSKSPRVPLELLLLLLLVVVVVVLMLLMMLFFWQTLWLCGIVSHLNIFILLWWVELFANCGVMTCHTFKVLRQIYGDKFWSAPELTPQRSLRLAPSFCLASVAWGACIVQGPSWWLMNWLHPSSWLKRNGWAHGTRTGTLTCRVTLKVHVFELLSHPAFWHSQFIQKTSIKWTSSWPFGFCCLGSLYCPRSKLMIDELVASFKLVEKKWMGTRNTYWHTYVQSNSESTCVWTPITSRFLTLTIHSENVYQMDKFLAFFLTDPLIAWNCFAFENIA